MIRALAAGLALAASLAAGAQPAATQANGILLVAKPTMSDPNFSRTVVLVSQTEDYRTIGVILNRPTDAPLEIPGLPVQNYKDRIYFGGPVSRQALVAVVRTETPPKARAFHVLKNVWLTMHRENVSALLADTTARYRLYAGFSGWVERQLENELQRDGWYVLPADEATIFREDTSRMWDDLLLKASGPRTKLELR